MVMTKEGVPRGIDNWSVNLGPSAPSREQTECSISLLRWAHTLRITRKLLLTV